MNKAQVGTEAVDLLSRITGQKLTERHLTPPVIFLAALVTLLLGVIYVDGVVTDEEKQRLQATLNKFVPTEGNVRQLVQLMLKGVGQLQIYKKSSELTILMAPLTAPQRLLLLGFGYQMSAADGDMDAREKKYLQVIANNLKVDPRYLAVLEASFSHQGAVEPNALEEVQSLLDPARFQELDTIFVEAASELLAVLPTKPEPKATQQKRSFPYEQLKEFQKSRQQIDNLCHQFYQIIKDCVDNELLPYTLPDEIGKISHKLQSQRFRVAVIGEFSQGKSTLLNALLGEEIQPVRAIPCSGTVTVLRYGAQKRVICCYKDGRKEDIPFDQYKIKAAISKEAALEHRSEELSNSNLDEIIFEHPDLDLCKSGIEIIDSPGLNEHPERTAITQKLLKDTDAAIFLTNAMRLLPEKEKELLQDVRNQLNGGKENEPADNLFIVVNFMDSLDDEQDRLDVKLRLESFVRDKNLLAGKNRIHYISAKSALKAILEGQENQYRKSFQTFTKSIEEFLTVERGSVQTKKFVSKIKNLIDSGLDGLAQAVEVVDGKIKISETQKYEILEKVGEASGRDVKIRLLADHLIDKVLEEAAESWGEWYEGLEDRMIERAERWHSEHNPAWSQDKLIKDYINQFSRDLSREIDNWGNQQFRDVILKRNIKVLDENIELELEEIQSEFSNIDRQVNTHFSDRLKLSINSISDDFMGAGGLMGGLGVGGALAAGLLAFTGLGLVAVVVASVAAAIAGSLGLGLLDFDGLKNQIKAKVLELGFQKFDDSMDKVSEKFYEIVNEVFETKIESTIKVIEQAISLYENLLEQQEKNHQETVEQRGSEKALIAKKCHEMMQMQKTIEAILA